MTDTPRSVADLQVLLADNTVGAISPQDLRDLLASVVQPYGSLHFTTPAPTTPAGAALKALGTTTSVNLSGFDMPVSNRLRYTGSVTRHAHIACSVSFTMGGNNKVAGLYIYHFDASADSGAVLDHSHIERFVGTGADIGSTALHADVMMDINDYLEIWVENHTDNAAITIEKGYLFVLGMTV